MQYYYEYTQMHLSRILTRLKELKKSNKEKTKKKKPANVFQTIIGSIFTTAPEEMWVQQNKDRHNCNNGANSTTVEKADNKIKGLYKKTIDSVLHYKHREKYFPLTLEQQIQQSLKKKKKRQWIMCWKDGICQSKSIQRWKLQIKQFPYGNIVQILRNPTPRQKGTKPKRIIYR